MITDMLEGAINSMKILADIGGTHARFAVFENGALGRFKKYKAQDFQSFREALEFFLNDANISGRPALRIATAAYDDNGLWRFVNQNQWTIDPKSLKDQGWIVENILNDFEAATQALIDMKLHKSQILKKGTEDPKGQLSRCLLGPGTGLGLGYLQARGKGGFAVQRTHGGHMPAAAITDEQHMIIEAVSQFKDATRLVVFENLVSGGGLYNIYRAQCLIADKPPVAGKPDELLTMIGDKEAADSIRLLHEFFGLFAATAVVCGHAYGGLYLTGGVLERLVEHKIFDFSHFEKFFVLNAVSSVRADLDRTPVYFCPGDQLALQGLLHD